MTYLYWGIGLLALIIAIILAIGTMLPVKHTASRSIELNAPTEKIWSLITNYADMPKWRKELLKVEPTTTANGTQIWQEFENEKQSLDFETTLQIESQKLVRKIVGENLNFGGTWTFELIANGNKTTLTIIENGEVYNALFRFVSTYIMGHHASLDKFIKQLKAEVNA